MFESRYKYCPINLSTGTDLTEELQELVYSPSELETEHRNLSTGGPWKILECKGTLTALIVHPSLPDMLTSKWVSETQAWGILFPNLLRGRLWSEAWIAIPVLSLTEYPLAEKIQKVPLSGPFFVCKDTGPDDLQRFRSKPLCTADYFWRWFHSSSYILLFLDIPHSYNKMHTFWQMFPVYTVVLVTKSCPTLLGPHGL